MSSSVLSEPSTSATAAPTAPSPPPSLPVVCPPTTSQALSQADAASPPPASASDAAPGGASAADPPAMSKSALKRQRKEEAFKAAKLQRRAYEKEKRKAKTAETRRLVAEGLIEKPAPKKKVVGKQTPHGARIVVDMGFDELMTEKEVKSMTSQLAYCYSANRNVQRPFPLLISSFNGRLRETFEKRKDHTSWRGVEWWEEGLEALYDGRFGVAEPSTPVEIAPTTTGTTGGPLPDPSASTSALPEDAASPSPSTSSAPPPPPPAPPLETSPSAKVQIGALAGRPRSSCPKSSVIYLTGDSPNVLTSLEAGKTYVLGGIVDRNRYKNLCLNKANELGIAHAQLPIGEFLPEMQTRKVLTVNQVYEILTNWVASSDGDWREALRKVMPERKFDPDARAKRRATKKGGAVNEEGVYVADEEGSADSGAEDEKMLVERVEEALGEEEHEAAPADVDSAALP
ncbi:hypothetical protein JCM6882_003061 [Rhodosporidiobolus microsporus]